MSRVSNDFKNDDMAKKLRAIRLIQELNLEMEAHWQLPEIFQLILRFLHEVFGFQYSMIYLLDFDSDTLSFQAGWGHPEGHHSDPIKLGQGYIGTSAKSGEILRIGNLRSAFLYSRAVRNRLESSIFKEQLSDPALLPEISPIKSQMSVPLKIKSNVIGVIVVESVKSNAFDELDQELLLIIAGQTAQFIDRVRRADQERMEKEELLDVMGHLHRLIEYLNTAFVEMNLPLDFARSRLGWAMLDSIQRPGVAIQAMKQCLAIFEQFDDSSYTFFTNTLSNQFQSIKDTQVTINKGDKILTNREWEVASQVAKGISNPEIASNLCLSVRTVTTHLERIYSKLSLRSRSALSRYMFEQRDNNRELR